MKKCTCLFAAAMLLVSLVLPVYAVDVPPVDTTDVDMTGFDTVDTVDDTAVVDVEPDVGEDVIPPEEDLIPSGVIGRSDTFSLSDRFVSLAELDGFTVNVSEDSISAIASAVSETDSGIVVTNKDGTSYSVPQEVVDAGFDNYKYFAYIGSPSDFSYWLLSNTQLTVTSDGHWRGSGIRLTYSKNSFVSTINSISIYGFSTRSVMFSKGNILNYEDKSIFYMSDVAESYVISFFTGFDDLSVDTQSSYGFSAPVLERRNYRFDGWYLDSDLTKPYTTDYVFVADTTLYAKWTPYRTVTFNTGIDDYVVNSVSVLDGTAYSVPAFSCKGYDFAGAYTDSKYEHIFVDGTVIDSDITLYLKFEKIVYDVGELLSEQVELSKGLQIIQSQLWIVLLITLFYFVYKFFRIFF